MRIILGALSLSLVFFIASASDHYASDELDDSYRAADNLASEDLDDGYRPPPRVFKDMGDKYKHMPDKPNYAKPGSKKTKAPKPSKRKLKHDEAMVGPGGELSPEDEAHAAMRVLEDDEVEFKRAEKENSRVEKEMQRLQDKEDEEYNNARKRQSVSFGKFAVVGFLTLAKAE
jgi:hypothetical protein